jgi:multiple sugar transport system substrate-binding protein
MPRKLKFIRRVPKGLEMSGRRSCRRLTSPLIKHQRRAMESGKSVPSGSRRYSRRSFVRGAGKIALAATAGPAIISPTRAATGRKTLRILQWSHFVPAFDQWFNDQYVKAWGDRNDTHVIVDNVGMTSIPGRARAQVAAGRGHDLIMYMLPPASLEQHLIDHSDIWQECERRYGKPLDLALKSAHNPKTRRYYGFCDSYVPDPVNYRDDLWGDIGVFPDSWDDIRVGGRGILERHRVPLGIGLAPELDSNVALRSILASFGAAVQDADSRPALRSPQTLDALRYVSALYREAMTDEVFAWDPSSNNRQLLAGRGSLTLNAISITRLGENQNIPLADRILLARPPAGPVGRIGFPHLVSVYGIWKFANNIDGAKQFLVDYVGEFRNAFLASQFYNFPAFPRTVPDLGELVKRDDNASPDDKYSFLANMPKWMTNEGYPGYANAATDEIFARWTISSMFANAARGKMSPEEALTAADREVQEVFKKWRDIGLV